MSVGLKKVEIQYKRDNDLKQLIANFADKANEVHNTLAVKRASNIQKAEQSRSEEPDCLNKRYERQGRTAQ